MSEALQYNSQFLRNYPMNESLKFFFDHVNKFEEQRVLEIGTKKWGPNSTHHKALFPNAKKYLMADFLDGEDVDIVVDIHKLTRTFDSGEFNIIWASSVYEHLYEPSLASRQILRALPPGGAFFIQTHNCFPLHGYPMDFYRFSTEALKYMFRKASQTVACYEFPCKIIPPEDIRRSCWDSSAPAYLNVCIAGVR